MSDSQNSDLGLGTRLRRLRQAKGLTLKELAKRVNKSESYLSRLERGEVNPTLSTLKAIADELGRSIIHLFDDDLSRTEGLIKKGEHRELVISPHLKYIVLSEPNSEISMFKMILKKGGNSGDRPYCHKGIECGILLKGKVRIVVGDREYILEEGDSLTYRSEEPHWFENVGDGDAVAIWVVTPPTF